MASRGDAAPESKPVVWVASSRKILKSFPKEVRRLVGQALFDAQIGAKHPDAKPLKGFGGAGVLEIVEDDDGNTYRAVYTIRFASAVYVLHVFQKKSKRGIKTPQVEVDRVKVRLKAAEKHYAEWVASQRSRGQGSR
jgi:phage-related protein